MPVRSSWSGSPVLDRSALIQTVWSIYPAYELDQFITHPRRLTGLRLVPRAFGCGAPDDHAAQVCEKAAS
jgi:hypothetical protein